MKRLRIALVACLIGLLSFGAVFAQETDQPDGSIRGTVYLDKDNDGKCGGDENEPTHPGTPIEFVSNSGDYTTFLQSGENGTYGLVAAGYGTWKVSARPNANDFVVTSEPTLNVFISEEEPLALNVDFCIRATGGTTPRAMLPVAGGAANNVGFIVAAVLGLTLVGAGGAIQMRRRMS